MLAGTWQARIQWHGKGDCAAKQGDYNRAIECYQQVLNFTPQFHADPVYIRQQWNYFVRGCLQALRAVPAMMEDSPVFPLHTGQSHAA